MLERGDGLGVPFLQDERPSQMVIILIIRGLDSDSLARAAFSAASGCGGCSYAKVQDSRSQAYEFSGSSWVLVRNSCVAAA